MLYSISLYGSTWIYFFLSYTFIEISLHTIHCTYLRYITWYVLTYILYIHVYTHIYPWKHHSRGNEQSSPPKLPRALCNPSPCPTLSLPPHPRQTRICLCHSWLNCISRRLYKWNHTVWILFCLASFTQHNYFAIHMYVAYTNNLSLFIAE